MRIHNIDEDSKIDKVGVFLTMTEAKTMKTELERLISKPAFNHSHVSTDDYHKEITIAIYDETKIDEYGLTKERRN